MMTVRIQFTLREYYSWNSSTKAEKWMKNNQDWALGY